MGKTNSPSVAHVGYDISPLSRVKLKNLTTRNPRETEGESIFLEHSRDLIYSSENFFFSIEFLVF
jgi:hypothetical protein